DAHDLHDVAFAVAPRDSTDAPTASCLDAPRDSAGSGRVECTSRPGTQEAKVRVHAFSFACDSGLDLVLGAVALALDGHGFGVMQQAVKQRRGEYAVVVEDAGPLLVDPVRCDQCGAALVAVAEDLEQAVGAELVDGQIAEFV